MNQALAYQGHYIEVWSGRSAEVMTETLNWLIKHGVHHSKLRMRSAGDYRQDSVVKAEWLDAMPEGERPALVFDDRQQVVDMWRRRHILCAQVAPGDF